MSGLNGVYATKLVVEGNKSEKETVQILPLRLEEKIVRNKDLELPRKHYHAI